MVKFVDSFTVSINSFGGFDVRGTAISWILGEIVIKGVEIIIIEWVIHFVWSIKERYLENNLYIVLIDDFSLEIIVGRI